LAVVPLPTLVSPAISGPWVMLNSVAPTMTGGDMLTVLDAINALTSSPGVQAAYNDSRIISILPDLL
jgi:hypothetical protein